MKKYLLILIAVFCFTNTVTAQTIRTLKKVMELKMPKTIEDDMPGTNGAAVVWHPLQKKYYSSMAGNAAYPLAVFDVKGKRLSSENLIAKIDVRGLWYDPAKKTICGNGYNDNGWFHYNIDPKGTVTGFDIDSAAMLQPNEQCVGTYHPVRKEVLFLNGNQVSLYVADGSSDEAIGLKFGMTKKDDIGEKFEWNAETPKDYNGTTVVFTAVKNAELGVLNMEKKQIELYDFKEGFLSTVLKLPDTVEAYPSFNFCFTNGMYWMFDKETRIWTAYK
jgi:hypothetical protein